MKILALLVTAAALAAAAPHASARTTQPEVSLVALADGDASEFLAEDPLTVWHIVAPERAPEIALPSPAQSRSKRGILVVILGSLVFLTGMVNVRTLRDDNLKATKALPAAGASNNSDSIDLETTTAGRLECVELAVELPATPDLVDDKTITLTVQDSDDDVTFAAIADLPAIVSTGAGGVGAAAIARQFKLPIGTRRYLRLNQAVLAAGGDNTAISSTLALVF